MAPHRVLHDLALLLHPVRLEESAVSGVPGVGIPSQPEPAVQQVAQLHREAAQVVAQRPPGLVLGGVGELVREHGGVGLAALGQEDAVPQRNGPPAAQRQDYPAKPARSSGAAAPVEAYPVGIQGERHQRHRRPVRRIETTGRCAGHVPRNSPIGVSDSMWSQMILRAAIIGTARMAPATPQMYHQNTKPMKRATVLSRMRRPRIMGVTRLPSIMLMAKNTAGTISARETESKLTSAASASTTMFTSAPT